MQFIMMVWNGISGLGVGTIFLKAIFILAMVALAWVLSELVKYTINVFAKLAVDGLRYLAVIFRGWPKDGEDSKDGKADKQ